MTQEERPPLFCWRLLLRGKFQLDQYPFSTGFITGSVETMCVNHTAYSFSKPWLVNFSVRLFSVTVRTT